MSDSLVLLGFLLLAGGAIVAWMSHRGAAARIAERPRGEGSTTGRPMAPRRTSTTGCSRRSRGGIVCMIDADLQYPPEVIPAMVSLVGLRRADVVVANRMVHGTGPARRAMSTVSGRLLRALHGLDFDVQSGLKVIRRGVLEQVPLHPDGWAVDLELLVRARAHGFRIATHDIRFTERRHGHTKLRLGPAS